MQCPKCSKNNTEDSNFCNECGTSLTTDALAPSTSVTEAERKRVTALFSDLTGYTAMTGQLDPEDVKEITTPIFNGIRKIIKRYGGFIERFAGDGGLVLFGVPKSHENDSIRAIKAAMDIHEFVKSLSPRFEEKLGKTLYMHSGINTGLAITADVDPEKGTHGVTGEAINIAARLSDIASADEIVVGQETYDICKKQFNFEALTPANVKGKTASINLYKVISARESAPVGFTNRQVFSEIVGRDKELNKLALHLTSAIDGKGTVVNIIGEAGIGKSRLFAEFSKLDVVKNVTLLEGKAISIGRTLPFYPIIDFLKNWAKIKEDDNEKVVLIKLESLVRRIDRDSINEIVPFISTLMGVKLSGQYEKRMEGIQGESLEKLIFKNLRDLLIKASTIKPLAIVVEDLHWADDSSIELLEVLFNLSKDYSILFINIFRPSFNDTGNKILNSLQNNTTIHSITIFLKPLDRALSERMVNNMLKIKGMSHEIRHKIIDRTGGNPFFIEEVVRSFIDEGAIVQKENEFVLTDKINTINVPHSITDLLTARIDRLEEKTRELIKIASVIGRNFFDKILKQVADSVDDIDSRLNYLKNVQLIREKARIEELEYLFKHAIAQEVAYKSLLHEKRKELHLNVANSIEAVFKKRLHEFYGTLAYHYTNADNLDKAEEYMLKAGEEAMKASASSEALSYYQKALDLYTNKHGKNVDKTKIADLQENIGTAFFNKGVYFDAFYYFNKSHINRGEKEWKIGIASISKLFIDFIVILRHLYLPSFRKKKLASKDQENFLKRNVEIGISLGMIDTRRALFENLKFIREGFKYDISKSHSSLKFVSGGMSLFSLTGISFKLANRFHLYIQEKIKEQDNQKYLFYYWMHNNIFNFLVGKWQVSIDEKLLKEVCRKGDLFTPTGFLLYSGYMKIEIADFKTCNQIINIHTTIGNEYNYLHAQSDAFVLKSKLLMKIRETRNAISNAENSIVITRKEGWESREVELLGIKARIYIIDNDFIKADDTFAKTKQLISKIGKTSIFINWLSDYYMGLFDFNIQHLAKAVNENNSTDFTKFKKEAKKSGLIIVKHSKKVASDRTEAFKLMGAYFWLINNQKEALAWWSKSINEGEQLGAKIELSRTYFEVGKHLQTPQSQHKELNGISGEEYLDKAKTMFEEMDLQWDLNELENISIIN